MFKNRKRRVRKHARLAFEILENRAMLAALPIPVGVSSHELGHAGHSPADHDSPSATFLAASMRDSSQYDVSNRHGDGDVNGKSPQQGSRTIGRGEFAPTTLHNKLAPPAIPNVSVTIMITGGFVTPTPIAELPALGRTVEVNSSLTVQSADLSGNVFQTDSLAEGEFAATPELHGNRAGSGTTTLSSTDTGISSDERQPQVDANAGAVFAAMADSDLLAVNLDFLDKLVEVPRTVLTSERDLSSATDADLTWYSPSDGLHAESTKAKGYEPFRKGFVDIEESVDDLLREQPARRQTEEGDRSGFQDDSTADSTAEHGERDHGPWRDMLWVREAHRLASQAARDAETTTRGQPEQSTARDGMVQLVHCGNSHADGLPAQAADADPQAGCVPSYLKMDGTVVRYQAFEVAPVPAPGNSEPLTSADSQVNEKPSAGDVSTTASDRSSLKSATACLVPAALAFLWRYRSRRDVQRP